MDLDTLFGITYDDYVEYLLNKYGNVPGYYFNDSYYKRRNGGILRSNEGLSCHHIDEDKVPNLSNRDSLRFVPNGIFEYQRPDRLVYCNDVEHMILHMKIVEKELSKPISERNQNNQGVGVGGFTILVKTINSYMEYIYNGRYPKRITGYFIKCAELLKGEWAVVYLKTIKYFVERIENRTDFIEWYGARVKIEKILINTNKIYEANAKNFNGDIVTEYSSIYELPDSET